MKKTGAASSGAGTHAYTEAEKTAYVEYVNSTLDPSACPGLPIDTEGEAIFSAFSQGVIFPKLIGASFPESIDLSKVVEVPKNKFEQNQNHDLAIESARKLGCSVVNIGGEDLLRGTPHLVMGLLWQIIKKALMTQVANNIDLSRLATGSETADELAAIPPEQILLRWFNLHLKNAGVRRVVTNFSSDLQDSECYLRLLHQIAPDVIGSADLDKAIAEQDPLIRAATVVLWADKLGCRKFVTAKAIIDGSPNLNLAFIATLFNAYPNIGPTADEKAKSERIEQLEADLFNLDALLGDSKKLEEEYKSALDVVRTEKSSLEEELAETTRKFQKVFDDNTELIVQKDQLASQVKALEEENAGHLQKLEQVTEEKDDLFSQLEEALGLGRDFEEKFKKTSAEVEALSTKAKQDEQEWMGKLQAEIEEKESLVIEVESLQTALDQQRAETVAAKRDTEEVMLHLEEEIKGKEALAKELSLQQQELKETKEQAAKIQEELLENYESTVQEFEKSRQESAEVESKLRSDLADETKRRVQTEEKMALLERESDDEKLLLLARIAQLEKELAETKERMAASLAQAAKDKEDALREAAEERDAALAEAEAEKDAALEKVRQLLSGSEKSGTLHVLSKNMAGMPVWKKRYFVLREGFLTFYKNDKDPGKQKPQGMIDCETTRLYEMEDEDAKRPFAFQIDSGPLQWNVAASSKNERDDWMTEIRVAKKKKLGVKVVSEETKDQRKARESMKRTGTSSGSGAISPR